MMLLLCRFLIMRRALGLPAEISTHKLDLSYGAAVSSRYHMVRSLI